MQPTSNTTTVRDLPSRNDILASGEKDRSTNPDSRQMSREDSSTHSSAASITYAEEQIEGNTALVRSEFYSQALYEGKALQEILPALAFPPPTYHADFQILSEKHALKREPSTSTPSSSSSSATKLSSTVNTDPVWQWYENDDLPEKTQGRAIRNLRHQVFSLYRRIFGIVFIVNMSVLVWIFAKRGTNAQELGLIVVANIFVAILMRQDYVINALFTVFCAVPRSWPLAIRRVFAHIKLILSIATVHSGCAVSGVAWLCAFTGQATRELISGGKTSVPTVIVTYIILVMLAGMVIFAYPKARTTHHDTFEKTHRFAGWTATALVWCQVVLLTNDYRPFGKSLGQALLHSTPFWLVIILTCSIISSWLRLRKVPVRAEILSNHAVRLYFDYVTTQPGQFTRLSESPLLEWHSFAAIAEPGKTGYSAVVSRAGDWTSRTIASPPTHVWVRGVPCYGVLRVTTMFRRVVLVGTGSGIGPLTPVILANRVPIRLLWTAPNVRQTFGDKLVDTIVDASPGAVIYDTRVHGKPDMVKLTYRLVREFNAEAVVIISNEKLTQKVVYGMMSRGIPAFGAIWDS